MRTLARSLAALALALTAAACGPEDLGPSGAGYTSRGALVPPPVADECVTNVNAGRHRFTCEGLTWDVTLPELCLSQSCGLILDVHGFTMSGEIQDANTRMSSRGAEWGYVVAQPTADEPPPAASWASDDDERVVGFVRRLMRNLHLDARRVHATGFSQGGFMSWRMLCDHSDLFASVAPIAAAGLRLMGDEAYGCLPDETPPDERVSVLYAHGVTDALVDYAFAEPQRDSVIAAYDLEPAGVVQEDGLHRWERYVGDDDTTLEFIRFEYERPHNPILLGHCFPGSPDQHGGRFGQLFPFGCVDDAAFRWGEVVVDFFRRHPKP